MKKQAFSLLAVAAVLVMALAGCSSTSSSSQPAPQPASQPASEPASQPEQGSEEGAIAGTLVDATMNTATIQTPDGKEYAFTTEGAEIDSPEGLLIGDAVTIYYTGTFVDGQLQQDVTVTRILVTESVAGQGSSTPAAAGGSNSDTEEVKTLQGVIDVYDGGDTMTVADATGVDFVLPLAGADLHVGEEGFAEGDEVIVYYTGTLVDTDAVQDVTVGEVRLATDAGV
ncbi:MAG: hypothetical protein GXY32_06820 [Ruminococcaceae bacterium]|nr:hypothetical protein [Oscillospiraceae bacterium]